MEPELPVLSQLMFTTDLLTWTAAAISSRHTVHSSPVAAFCDCAMCEDFLHNNMREGVALIPTAPPATLVGCRQITNVNVPIHVAPCWGRRMCRFMSPLVGEGQATIRWREASHLPVAYIQTKLQNCKTGQLKLLSKKDVYISSGGDTRFADLQFFRYEDRRH